jgi:molybdopterin-guanine dinucleotide biosynthesis adapter protein
MKVFGIIGWKNAGKTSLMERLVADITARGFTVSTVKHVHHDVDLDQPGKDTYRHRVAGAVEVVLASANRFALLHEHRGAEPTLADVLTRLAPVDLVLVEGYKRDSHAKVEVFRDGEGRTLIQPGDPTVRAVATDAAVTVTVPVIDLNDTKAVADFVLTEVGLTRRPTPSSVVSANNFDTVIVVDWSAKAVPSPMKESKDAIWIGICRENAEQTRYYRTRIEAEMAIITLLDTERATGRRVLAAFDFPMGYPSGFAERLTGTNTAQSVWKWLADNVIDDARNATNRLQVGGRINALFHPLRGPFWGRPASHDIPHLAFTKDVDYHALGLSERRAIEKELRGAKTVWQLMGAGSVGSQALTGLPMIHRLQQSADCKVWPFEDITGASVVIAEIYPAIISMAVAREIESQAVPALEIPDKWQVHLLARALFALSKTGKLESLMDVPEIATEEGWILGAGYGDLLEEALTWR